MNTGWRRWVAGRSLPRTLLRAAVLGALLYYLLGHWARPVRVQGISMEPTLRDGSFRLARLRAWAQAPPGRGDIVVIALPGGRTYYAKRVLGLPGETVELRAGQLFINGQPRAEPYLADRGRWTAPAVRLNQEEFFVAGDNRSMPMVEQVAGVVAQRLIVGGLWW